MNKKLVGIKRVYINRMEKKTWNHLKINQKIIEAPYIDFPENDKKVKMTNERISLIPNEGSIQDILVNKNEQNVLNNVYVVEKVEKIETKTESEGNEDKKNIMPKEYFLSEEEIEEKLEKEENKKIVEDIVLENEETRRISILNDGIMQTSYDIKIKENAKSWLIVEIQDENVPTYRDNNIRVVLSENSELEMIVIFKKSEKSFSLDSIYIEALEGSKANIIYVIEGEEGQSLKHISRQHKDATIEKNAVYVLGENKRLDYIYLADHVGEKSESNLLIEGFLYENAFKSFKGVVNFRKGTPESDGKESENTLILSDKATAKSAPILLCAEENVNGNHASSLGKIDDKKLFYLMARGYTKKEAIKAIVLSKITPLLFKEIEYVEQENEKPFLQEKRKIYTQLLEHLETLEGK